MNEPLTDDELEAIRAALYVLQTSGRGETLTSKNIAAIIARREPVKWLTTTHGALAEFRGWTLTVRPTMSTNGYRDFAWSCTRHGKGDCGDADTRELAQQAAEKYARERPL